MNIFQWLVTSSADPKRYSLMVKGVLILAGGYLLQMVNVLCGVGLYCAGIDAEWINQIVEALTNIVYLSMMLIGALGGLAGLMRKINLKRWAAPPRGR